MDGRVKFEIGPADSSIVSQQEPNCRLSVRGNQSDLLPGQLFQDNVEVFSASARFDLCMGGECSGVRGPPGPQLPGMSPGMPPPGGPAGFPGMPGAPFGEQSS